MGGRGGASHRASAAGGMSFPVARDFLTRAYGVNYANAILNYLDNAPDYIQEMWVDYGGSFRAARADPDSDEAYYSPSRDDVFLGIRNVARGDSIHPPYATVFHEYGHMTDYLIARTQGYGAYSAYSDIYKNGLLGRTAKSELQGHINRFVQTGLTEEQAKRALIQEATRKYSMRNRSDISDMFEGAGIGIAYPLSAGHGLDYWGSRGNSREIFAEITSAEAAHPGSLTAIKDYFPQTYNVYIDMLKERKIR